MRAVPATRIPRVAADITSEWLTTALQPRHPGARVAAVEIVGNDEVTNQHVRLRVTYEEPAGAPELLFGKLLPLDPDRRESIALTRMGPREARFYAELAPQLALRVPQVHVAAIGTDEHEFVVLLEDLDASGCQVSDGTWGITRDGAAQALEDLAAMHVRYEDPARRAAEADWVPPYSAGGTYAVDRLQFALDHHRDRISDEFAAVSELYIAHRLAVHELWTGPDVTVVHGDTHIGNLFVEAAGGATNLDAGRVGFYDWGVIHLDQPLRDVSYLLQMAMQPDDRRAHEAELLRHYLAVRAALGGAPMTFDDAWAQHRLRASYTVVASCQVVTFPEDISPQREVFADAFLARAEAAVQDLDAVGALTDALEAPK
jgi:hypothetical protein